MSDPVRFGATNPFELSAERLAEISKLGAEIDRRCPGALLETGRQRCSAQVLERRRGQQTYRSGLCARCADLERQERAECSMRRQNEGPAAPRRSAVER